MKSFVSHNFDVATFKEKLDELRTLLSDKIELGENEDILPFFKGYKHVAAAVGFLHSSISFPDRIAHELDLFGGFRCDLAVGDSRKKAFCLVEFEDAKKNSIFRDTSRATPEWSPRFEHGFSQIVDWYCKLADQERSDAYEDLFGARDIDCIGVLVIGRSQFLDGSTLKRLEWRRKNVLVDSKRVICFTFDQLLADLDYRLQIYTQLGK